MSKHTDKELDATAAHVKALGRILDAHSAGYIVRACSVFADIEEGISLIVRKDHYYQLEAQAKSHEELLTACKWIGNIINTASDGGDAWCALRNQPGAQQWAKGLKAAIANAGG